LNRLLLKEGIVIAISLDSSPSFVLPLDMTLI